MSGDAMFFSLNQPEHWKSKGLPANLTPAAGLELSSGQQYSGTQEIELQSFEDIRDVVSFAVGSHGRIVLLDDQGSLWIKDPRNLAFDRLFHMRDELFSPSSMLAVAKDTLIAADPSGERTLAAFDMSSGQTKWSRSGAEADGIVYAPLALASAGDYIYVLSLRDEALASHEQTVPLALLRFTLSGALDAVIADRRLAAVLPTDRDSGADTVSVAVDMAVSAQGSVFVYDREGGALFVVRGERVEARKVNAGVPLALIAADSRERIYAGTVGRISDKSEDDRFIRHFDDSGAFAGLVSGYRGQTDALAMDDADRMYVYNKAKQTISILDMQPQTLNWPGTATPRGLWISRAFDSLESGTVWHKFTLDAEIPDGTQLRVRYFASDHRELLIAGSIRPVNEWLSDDATDADERLAALETYWSEPVINPRDALFFAAEGRYLWLYIEWIGSKRHSPSLRRMRVYFPRETLIGYLPAVYQEDDESRDFLERYLSLFAAFFDATDERIDGMLGYFDKNKAEGARLRWLASWLGLEAGEHWNDSWVRKYVQTAPELYRYRGTRRGMERIVEVFTGMKPILVEWFQYENLRDQAELRWLSDMLYGDDPFTFTVLLHPHQAPGEKEKVLLQQLIDDFKPAHTKVKLVWLQPWMYVDLHTYLGVNSVLTEPSLLTIGEGKAMPNDTLLLDDNGDRRLDTHTRLEMDSELE